MHGCVQDVFCSRFSRGQVVENGIRSGEFQIANPIIAVKAIATMIPYCFQFYQPESSAPRGESVRS
jgi:hypothetical protein